MVDTVFLHQFSWRFAGLVPLNELSVCRCRQEELLGQVLENISPGWIHSRSHNDHAVDVLLDCALRVCADIFGIGASSITSDTAGLAGWPTHHRECRLRW